MDTDSVYRALAEKELEYFIGPEMKAELERLRSKDCTDCFTADTLRTLFPRMCCDKHTKHEKRGLGLLKEEFRC